MKKKRIAKKLIAATYEVACFSMEILNENGVHAHKRNGRTFRGRQANCPLCADGSSFEKAIAKIAVD